MSRRAGAASATVAVCLLVASLLAACGGGGAEAAAVCTEAAAESVVAFEDAQGAAAGGAGALYRERLAEIQRREAQALREAESPEGVSAETWDAFVAARELAADAQEEAVAALAEEDGPAFARASENAEQLSARARELAEELSLQPCARRLSEQEREAVREAVKRSALSDEPRRVCEELATRSFVELFGGIDGCVTAQRRAPRPERVRIAPPRGVDGVEAEADITLLGGDYRRPEQFRVTLFHLEGAWRVAATERGGA